MTLKEIQDDARDALNADEALRAGGCEAISEMALDLQAALGRRLSQMKGVAMVVGTPSANAMGAAPAGLQIPVVIDELSVTCMEIPAINRTRPGAMTALEAAERAAWLLRAGNVAFLKISQSSDEASGVVSATATFRSAHTLTQPAQPD